jgi:hypothetical protein
MRNEMIYNSIELNIQRMKKLVSDPYLLYLANKNMLKLKKKPPLLIMDLHSANTYINKQ